LCCSFFIFAVTGPFHEMLGGSRTTAYLWLVASVLSFFVSLDLARARSTPSSPAANGLTWRDRPVAFAANNAP